MKSKIRNLHPHRVIVDDDLATRLATGIWEPPPSTSTHAADENDDEAADHSDDQPSDELKIARIVRREPGTAKELAAAFLRFNREWALIWKPYSVLHIASGDVYSIKSFLGIKASHKINLPSPTGKIETRSVASMWQAWKYCRAYRALAYAPGEPPEIREPASNRPPAWNLWRGFAVEPKHGDITLWLRLLDHLFDRAHEPRRYFERWCANQIQNVGIKHYVALMLWGIVQGSGKSLTGEVIGSLFGDNYHELSNIAWRSDFNGWARCKRFVLINEIVTSRDNDIDLLKNLISQQSVDVNQKMIEQYKLDDTISYLLTSNKPDALKLEDSDRRFWVWEVARRIDQELANAIGAWKRTIEGRAALLHHLMHLDLDGFDPRVPAPMTSAKENMIAAGRATVDQFVRDEIDAARDGHTPPVALADQLLQRFDATRSLKDPSQEMGRALGRAGAARLKQVRVSRDLALALGVIEADDSRFPRYGKHFRPWALADKENWLAATEDEIRSALENSATQSTAGL